MNLIYICQIAGVYLVYFLPYSPDLNLIKELFTAL